MIETENFWDKIRKIFPILIIFSVFYGIYTGEKFIFKCKRFIFV